MISHHFSSNRRLQFLPWLLAATLCKAAMAGVPEQAAVPTEPVALGAWLYRDNCHSCHGDYHSARLAENFSTSRELGDAISHRGCQISWARNRGGPFDVHEIAGLTLYMEAWEELDEEPPLPQLPPQLSSRTRAPLNNTTGPGLPALKATAETTRAEETPPAPLRRFIERNPVAAGGYLYTRNCYRCHLDYQQARMGKGQKEELVRRIIMEGKTSTQMKPFSNLRGGPLKNREIGQIVRYIITWEAKGEPLAIAEELMTPPALDPTELQPIRLPRFLAVRGTAETGESLFRRHCGICHGMTGEGFTAGPLLAEWAGMRPDLYFKAVIKAGIPQTLMGPWDSNHNGPLSPKDIDDVVAYLLGR